MICVLLLAAGAGWESDALTRLSARSGVVVLKRCVDVDDLLASAGTGQADVAVVAIDAPGLDAAAVAHLRRHGVRPVAVVPGASFDAPGRAALLEVSAVLPDDGLEDLAEVVATVDGVDDTRVRPGPGGGLGDGPDDGLDGGSVGEPQPLVAVWGPTGAPGRTTVATSLAAELARRGRATTLVDADPYGGAVAQQLGVLDEVSGMLSAVRLAAGGQLDRLPSACRRVGERLDVLTGLPRADRWSEVRGTALEQVLEHLRAGSTVVADTGFCLEDDGGSEYAARPGRNTMTTTCLELADEVVVVGSADPVGLSRLARGLVILRDLRGGAPVRVVVNRMRPTLGWAEREIAGMVEGFARVGGLHFWPDDQAAADRALVSGRSIPESGDSPLARAVAELASALLPEGPEQPGRRRRAVVPKRVRAGRG